MHLYFHGLDLPSTPIRHENRVFRKCSSYWRNLKTPAFRLRIDGNILKTEVFETTVEIMIIMRSPCPRLSQTQIQYDWWLLRFSGIVKRKTFDAPFSNISGVFRRQGLERTKMTMGRSLRVFSIELKIPKFSKREQIVWIFPEKSSRKSRNCWISEKRAI